MELNHQMVLQQPDDDLGDPGLVQGKGWGHGQLAGEQEGGQCLHERVREPFYKLSYILLVLVLPGGVSVHRGCSHTGGR